MFFGDWVTLSVIGVKFESFVIFSLNFVCMVTDSFLLFQVYKVIVNVGRQEWFVFRRYAEFDKLYNTVSAGTKSMLFDIICENRQKQFMVTVDVS